MKKIANFILLGVLFTFGFVMVFSRMSGIESLQINNTLRQDTYQMDFVQIPRSEQEAAFDTVLKLAKEDRLNVYRYDQTDAQNTTLYLGVNYQEDKIFSALHTTSKLENPNPKSFISSSNAYSLRPINKELSEVGYVGILFIQGSPSAIQKVQTALSPYTSQTLQPQSPVDDNLALVVVQVAVSVLVFGLVVSLFLVNFYRNYRDLNVLLLQGYSKSTLLLQIVKENYLLPVLGIGLILVVLGLIFSNLSVVFFWTYLLTISGILVSFGVTLLALRNYKISPEILNGRNPLKVVSRVNRVLAVLSSVIIALSFVFFGNMVTHIVGQLVGEAQVTQALSDYSASSLINIDLATQNSPSKEAAYNLQETSWFLPKLHNQAILYLPNGTEQKTYIRHEIMISSAYLTHFPIYDSQGKRVEVKNSETSLVELVPIGLKNQTAAIRSQVTENHEQINFGAYEQATGKKVSTPVTVKIIYIQPSHSPFDLSVSNSQTLYRVLTSSNISPTSIYADLFIGETGSGDLYLKKSNPVGDKYNNDPDKVMGLSMGEDAGHVYTAYIAFQLKYLSPFTIAFTISVVIYLFSLFFGFSQFRKLGKEEIRTKVLLGARKRNLYLPYLLYHFVFSLVLVGLGVAISNSYVILLAIGLLGLLFVVYAWSGRREKKLYVS